MAALTAAGVLFVAGQAMATTITTTSLSTWESSTYTVSGSQQELNFTGVNVGTTYDTATGIVLNAINHPSVGYDFTGPDNGTYNLTGVAYNRATGLAGASDGAGYINVATPSNGANSLFLSIGSTGGTPLTLLLSDGESFSGLSPGLFGFSLSHQITWLELSTVSGSQPVFDDFYYGTSSLSPDAPTSEAATFLLMGGGLLILFGARHKLFGRVG
ncbi:MAG: hypothetical protein JO097_10960 [Acidobacteriaceae bacterium]|nr:hypothetical protein [Acidobacteriaceae bacterium]